MSKNFTYHTKAKTEAEAIDNCLGCYMQSKKSKAGVQLGEKVATVKTVKKTGEDLFTITGTVE